MKEIHRQGPKRGEDLPYLNRFLKRPKREEDGTCRIALNRFSKIIPQILILILHQVLHRPQNKEKPMQNNFDSPVRVTQNDFRV